MGIKSILFGVSEVNGISHKDNALIVSAVRVFHYATHWEVIDSDGNVWVCSEVANYKQFTREEL